MLSTRLCTRMNTTLRSTGRSLSTASAEAPAGGQYSISNKGEMNRARSYKDLGKKLDLKGDKYIDGLESLIEQANKID